ncbi:MFS transporter [Leifsonia sp. Root227]|uniref:MFS transporter n=1 Tax=Leifsonia sp. Root227 TaxID=1736496 RepID=UPI000A639452|nr:MFS transporter [Leifsonia sp. Root227]
MTTPSEDTTGPTPARPVQPTIPSNLSGVPESASLASTITTAGSPFSAAPTSAVSAQSPVKVKVRGKLLKLMLSMMVGNIAIFAIWGAVPGVLLPLQVQGIVGDADKGPIYGLVATIGAFAAMIAQPIAGLVSDRTRSRFGRRAPWMVIGVLLGGLSLLFMGAANGIVQLTVAWVMVQVTFNFAQGPLSAILPDRVPSGARGTFSSLSGLGLMLGSLGGSIAGAQFAKSIPAGYLTFAGIALIVIVLFVIFNPDASNKGEPKPPFNFVTFLQTFWVSPRKHPDFFWGFTGRLLLYAGYFMVTGFQLYILQDYIGLKGDAVTMVPVLSLISLVGIIITTLIGGPVSDRIGRRKIVVIVAGAVMAISLVFPLIIPSITGMMLFAFVSGLGFGAYQAVDTALMSEVLPSKNDFAKDLGVLNIAATLPQTLAPGLAGLIVFIAGNSYTPLFPIGIVLALLGAFAVMPIKSVR